MAHQSATFFRLTETLAAEILHDTEAALDRPLSVPIRLDAICSCLRLDIGVKAAESGLPGEGIYLQHERRILLERGLERHRRRFSLAHEIAHAVLAQAITREPNLRDMLADERPQPPQSRKSDPAAELPPTFERAADQIAAAVLMPAANLRDALSTCQLVDKAQVRDQARRFEVAVEVMRRRVADLRRAGTLDGIQFESECDRWLEARPVMAARAGATTPLPPAVPSDEPATGLYDPRWPASVCIVLEELVQAGVQVQYRNGPLPRASLGLPFVIEFAGLPNTGKDTQIHILEEYFTNVRGYRVMVVNEGYRDCRLEGVSNFERYLWGILTTCRSLLLDKTKREVDILIVNRGIFDALAYLRLHQRTRGVGALEARSAATLLLMDTWRNLIDVVFLLGVEPGVSLDREKRDWRERAEKLARQLDTMVPPRPPQRVVTPAVLDELQQCYEWALATYGRRFRRIHLLPEADRLDVDRTSLALLRAVHADLPPSRPPAGVAGPLLAGDAKPTSSEKQLRLFDAHG